MIPHDDNKYSPSPNQPTRGAPTTPTVAVIQEGGKNKHKHRGHGGKAYASPKGKRKMKGFTSKLTEVLLKNIKISRGNGIMAPQYYLLSECVQAYADNDGMSHMVLCLKDLKDRPDDDFKVAKANLLSFTTTL